jgi:hypothetical protein
VGTSDAKVHVLDHEASLLRATELAWGPVRGPSLPLHSFLPLSARRFSWGRPDILSVREPQPRARWPVLRNRALS